MPARQAQCVQDFYPNEDIDTTTIPVGTILYSGARDSFPTSKENNRLVNRTEQGTHYFKFFTPNLEVAKQFASLEAMNLQKKGYIGIYKVLQPLTIYLNYLLREKYNEHFYFNTPQSYASPEAQCLCTAGFHGYGSMTPNGLDDIGLCTELDKHLELVGYFTTKSKFKNRVNFGGRRQTKRRRHSRKH